MTTATLNGAAASSVDREALKKLREPFPPEQVGKLPKGGALLDFVGHGYLTARFLDVDPEWTWEPFAVDANGLPLFDENGGLWIRLTIAGVTRIGYGDGKGPDAVKQAIGDALRNAGMRFGAALDLWCKGDPDRHDSHEPAVDHASVVPPEVEAANAARGTLLAKTEPYGWDADGLIERFRIDKNQDLLAVTDLNVIDKFTELLLEEARKAGTAYVKAGVTPPADQPEGRISTQQLRLVHTLFSKAGITDEADKHEWCSDALGFLVGSTKDLTASEADTLITKLRVLTATPQKGS